MLLSINSLVIGDDRLAKESSGQATAAKAEGVIATVQPIATDAGMAAFQRGGNAVDAAIWSALMLGVVDNHNSGIGGGCFILVRSPDGSFTAIDGRETAPAAATPDMFQRDGKAVAELSTTGPLAVAVPGALAAYDLALKTLGRTRIAAALNRAANVAEDGFAIDRIYARNLRTTASKLARFAGSKQTLLKPDGSPYVEGETLVQTDLARTYRQIASRGIDWFYRGEFAQQVGQWMSSNGGLITADDFASYQPVIRQPIRTRYREHTIVGFPPPSSGGVHVAQILNILESFDLPGLYRDAPLQAQHVIVEAMKLAFADRAHWLGDADFVTVPKGLVSKEYGRSLAMRIDPKRSSEVPSYGDPLPFDPAVFGRHTTHIAAADEEGYWVAITQTVNTSFGSKVIVPGTGVVLNNEMDDFSAQPGVANAFGLVGAENNAVAAGKRPLSSMSPTIILGPDDQPVMTVGAAGGPKIITQVLLMILRCLDGQQTLQDAIAGPRFHHQWKPDQVLVEQALSPERIDDLKSRGHKIKTIGSSGITQAIARDNDLGLIGVHDPRVPGEVGRHARVDSP
ncbi:MAG: gamma-glutamyltransferase [Planctomycetota bacterium]